MKCDDCLHVFSLPFEYVKVIDCLMTSCRIEEPNNLVLISADSWERVKMHNKFCMWCQFMLTICVYAAALSVIFEFGIRLWSLVQWILVWACRLYSDWKQSIPALKANYCSYLRIICASFWQTVESANDFNFCLVMLPICVCAAALSVILNLLCISL